ncbi:transposase family protein [Streptomyces luteireticuli]|uniref:transposase family protein n=1 Tax=Streptomyces luteireticuli TaxID=173858 RepID=UPI003557F8F2
MTCQVVVHNRSPDVSPVCHGLFGQVRSGVGVFRVAAGGAAGQVAGPRWRRGRRHPFVAVLLVAASAVVAGARSYTAIAQWARHAPQEALARLGVCRRALLNVRVAPSRSTIRRVVTIVCPGGLADLTGSDPTGGRS